MSLRGDQGSGAAKRRGDRRLRMHWRHEQLTLQMPLASVLHHSADMTSRALHDAPRGPKNAGTECYELSDEDVVLATGSRPPCLGEPRGPQERMQPNTMEQLADVVSMVQVLDFPVAQEGEEGAGEGPAGDFAQTPRHADPGQAIEVPQ